MWFKRQSLNHYFFLTAACIPFLSIWCEGRRLVPYKGHQPSQSSSFLPSFHFWSSTERRECPVAWTCLQGIQEGTVDIQKTYSSWRCFSALDNHLCALGMLGLDHAWLRQNEAGPRAMGVLGEGWQREVGDSAKEKSPGWGHCPLNIWTLSVCGWKPDPTRSASPRRSLLSWLMVSHQEDQVPSVNGSHQ